MKSPRRRRPASALQPDPPGAAPRPPERHGTPHPAALPRAPVRQPLPAVTGRGPRADGAPLRDPALRTSGHDAPVDLLPAGLIDDLRQRGLLVTGPLAPMPLNLAAKAALPSATADRAQDGGRSTPPTGGGRPSPASRPPRAGAPARSAAVRPAFDLLPEAPLRTPSGPTLPFDIGEVFPRVEGPARPDPTEVTFVGNPATRPLWTRGLRLWTDSAGRTNLWTPDTGTVTWTRDGRQLGVKAPGQEEAERIVQTALELERNAGLRYVDGKGWLSEAAWTAHKQQRSQQLAPRALARLDTLREGNAQWARTQRGFAYLASVPSHVLGGRWFGADDAIARDAEQDVRIALREIETARTPAELREAEEHLRHATERGDARVGQYHEDVYLGGDRSITGIKVGAVATTAVLAAPVLAGALGVGAAGSGTAATLGLGGKLLAVGGVSLGTGLLTGTIGGATESAHRGWRWENYGKGFADYAPVGLGYGAGAALGGLARLGALPRLGGPLARGALIDATASGFGGAADRGLHGGDAGEILDAAGTGFLLGGASGGLGRAIDLGSPLARVLFGTGLSTATAWGAGADADEVYRQALLGGAISGAGAIAEQGSEGGTGRDFGRWLRPRAAAVALRLGQGIEGVPSLGGRSPTPSLPVATATRTPLPSAARNPPAPNGSQPPRLAHPATPRWLTAPAGTGGLSAVAGLPDLGPPVLRWSTAPAGEEVFGQLAVELATETPGSVVPGRTRNRFAAFEPADASRAWAAVPAQGGLADVARAQTRQLGRQLDGFNVPADRVLEAPWIGRIRNAAGQARSSGTSAGWARNEAAFWSAFAAQFPADYALLGPQHTVTAALAEQYGWPDTVIGDKLVHHHMENSSLVVALPESLHVGSSGAIHARTTVHRTP